MPGSTAALTTIEYEPGLLVDLPFMLERIAPRDGSYMHESRWHVETVILTSELR
ncbi:MAG TPA: YjbQ family protein [Candidatus Bathyarchaeia archaeon]